MWSELSVCIKECDIDINGYQSLSRRESGWSWHKRCALCAEHRIPCSRLRFYWRVILREYASGTNTAALVSERTRTISNTVHSGKKGEARNQNKTIVFPLCTWASFRKKWRNEERIVLLALLTNLCLLIVDSVLFESPPAAFQVSAAAGARHRSADCATGLAVNCFVSPGGMEVPATSISRQSLRWLKRKANAIFPHR